MTRRKMLYLILGVGSGILILFYGVWHHEPVDPVLAKHLKALDDMYGVSREYERLSREAAASTDQNANLAGRSGKPGGSFSKSEQLKWNKVQALYDSLAEADWEGLDPTRAHPKAVEILTEGMDAFRAAKYLRALGGGYSDYALEYADRAVAENPDSFDVLFFKTSITPYYQAEALEAGFRQLSQMDPHSIDVLFGLGHVLATRKPAEAVEYLEKVVEMNPSSFNAYMDLGDSYRELGRLDEALASFQKAYEIVPGWMAQNGIDAIKGDMEWYKTHGKKWVGSKKNASEETAPKSPVQENEPLQALTEGPEQGIDFSEEPFIEPPESHDDIHRTETRQAMEAEFEKLLAEYERMIRGDSSPDGVVNQQISDLKQSLESSPNRPDRYLELGQTYEKAGEDKKAAAVYRQARKRFPKDKRFQRTLKDGSRTKRRSESNRSGRAHPPQRSDQDKDPRSEDKR